jgi:DNA-binding transcriptional regulator YhcF (GntR family)
MIVVDPASPVPPTEQIRSQIAALIRAGELSADARLPTVRQLAGDLGVANGTVARAYRELESAGLVRTGRAAGTRVNPGKASGVATLVEAERFAAASLRAGLTLEQAQGVLATVWPKKG